MSARTHPLERPRGANAATHAAASRSARHSASGSCGAALALPVGCREMLPPIQEDRMLATTSSAIGRLSRTALVALPFAVVACGGDKRHGHAFRHRGQARDTGRSRRARRHSGDARQPGGSGVSSTGTYENADAAYKAGNYRDAAELYKVRVGEKPGDAFGFYMLGLSSWKAGDFDRREGSVRQVDRPRPGLRQELLQRSARAARPEAGARSAGVDREGTRNRLDVARRLAAQGARAVGERRRGRRAWRRIARCSSATMPTPGG